MKKLVVGYDGSGPARQAARIGARLAERLGAKITVLTVGQIGATAGTALAPAADERAFLPIAMDGADIVRALGVDPEVRVELGEPAQMIVDIAAQESYDLVVVGHRGLGGIKGLLLGSVAKKVATDAPCPVLVVRETAPETIRKVLAAIDGSEHALRALRAAIELAKPFGGSITLLNVIDARALAMGPHGPAMLHLWLTLQVEGQKALMNASETCKQAGIECERVQLEGGPANAIYQLATDESCDLVAVGRRGLSGLERLLLGSVSDDVLGKTGPLVLLSSERRKTVRKPSRKHRDVTA